jgi:hypothetical protein
MKNTIISLSATALLAMGFKSASGKVQKIRAVSPGAEGYSYCIPCTWP